MVAEDQTVKLLITLIEKLGDKVDALDSKVSSVNGRCSARESIYTTITERMKSVEETIKHLQTTTDQSKLEIRDLKAAEERNEWKIFIKMTAKLAVFILLLGSTALFLYQVWEKFNNPAAPLPQMPSIP